ncbi:MAG: hypothetical protein IT168_15430 [Bryobacterales bacterium]|nr:hypothetical protein [Bryobacterales bacterium]
MLRLVCISLLSVAVAGLSFAESRSERVTYTYDLNGRKVEASRTESNGGSSETVRNLNGQTVPRERTQDQILINTPDRKVTERMVQLFDSNGRPAGRSKIRMEEQKLADGKTSMVETVYNGDVNGSYAVLERKTTLVTSAPGTQTTEIVSERPSINGTLTPAEKRLTTRQGNDQQYREETSIYRAGDTGVFRETDRELRTAETKGSQTTTQVDRYNTNATGKMDLVGQEVHRNEKRPDGSESELVDVFGVNVLSYSAKPTLREQQIIDRQPTTGGSTETLSIRRADPATGKLGEPRPVSEIICRGDCKP